MLCSEKTQTNQFERCIKLAMLTNGTELSTKQFFVTYFRDDIIVRKENGHLSS